MRTALTVAGSDSVGGAGLQTDIKAMASLGVHAATVVTAVTAQNTTSVDRVFPVPADMVTDQLHSVFSDCEIHAAKTGMLYDAEIVKAVADEFEDRDAVLVCDPVMVATVGDSLYDKGFVKALKERLIPVCELLTPNLAEAETLTGIRIEDEDDAIYACEILGKEGSAVLLKGGHGTGPNVVDYLYLSSEVMRIKNPRLEQPAGHGSGCALSAYITANLANGLDMTQAVLEARKIIQKALETQYEVGRGVPVVNTMTKIDNDDNVARMRHLRFLEDKVSELIGMLSGHPSVADGCNILYALDDPKGLVDVASVDGGITLVNGKPDRGGPVRYGVSGRHAQVMKSLMHSALSVRCLLYIPPASGLIRTAKSEFIILNGIDDKTLMVYPDILVEGRGRSAEMYIIGGDPDDVLSKLRRLLRSLPEPSRLPYGVLRDK